MEQPIEEGAGRAFVAHHEAALRSLLEGIVPADDFPSASEAGGLDFLASILDERADWVPRAGAVLEAVAVASQARFGRSFKELREPDRTALLDALLPDADYGWFVRLVNGGYYADPQNGGNRAARSWDMVGWRADPPGGWPDLPPRPDRRVFSTPETLLERYDAIVVGSGAGGGVAACGLAEAGRQVLVVEAGGWRETGALRQDHLRNPRSVWGLDPTTGPLDEGSPRVLEGAGAPDRLLRPSDPLWGNNAMTAGGGTRVYGAQAWRFGPKDFTMASTYGVPEGSDLADWPIGYDDMEPYYERAEWEIGVSGDSTLGRHAGRQRKPYPMPAVAAGPSRAILAAGAEKLGIGTHAVPLLINSRPWLGRPACAHCAMCVGFPCPVEAKNGSHNTVLDRAFATGRTTMLLETSAERLLTDAEGRVVGVALVGMRDGVVWRKQVHAGEVVLSAGAVETARLLLNSASGREPDGIGNNLDQVGRRLQGHLYGGATAIFEEVVEDLVGPGPSIATTDFRHGNAGLIGGGILADEFVALPANVYRYLVDSGLMPPHGHAAKRGMRHLTRRMTRIMGPIQEVTSAQSRVRIDRSVRDRLGIPVARLSGDVHAEDLRGRDFLSRTAAEWLRAAGAVEVAPLLGPRAHGPSSGQHQAGTCRMGTDPARSVTDPYGRVWGHDNLRIADGSLHVTNGGVNPVLTIFANAMRVIEHMTK
jgi:choline dehydrogenase-like flavoprotein